MKKNESDYYENVLKRYKKHCETSRDIFQQPDYSLSGKEGIYYHLGNTNGSVCKINLETNQFE